MMALGPMNLRLTRAIAAVEQEVALLADAYEYNSTILSNHTAFEHIDKSREHLAAALVKLRQGKIYDLDDQEACEVERALGNMLRHHPSRRPLAPARGLGRVTGLLTRRGQERARQQLSASLEETCQVFHTIFASASLARPDVVLTRQLAERLRPELDGIDSKSPQLIVDEPVQPVHDLER